MRSKSKNPRRRFLGYAVAFLAGVGATFASIPFIRSRRHSQPLPPIDVDVSKMVDGQILAVRTPHKPTIYVLKRSSDTVEQLLRENSRLTDPLSLESDQPEYARNVTRSIRPEFLVVEALCTHLGCNVGHIAAGTDEHFPEGGFMCPCHGARYDSAGRVWRNGPSPRNLGVPQYSFVDSHTIRLEWE